MNDPSEQPKPPKQKRRRKKEKQPVYCQSCEAFMGWGKTGELCRLCWEELVNRTL